jgi:hypothetical protein
MRRASTCLAVLGLAILGLPSAASAAPTITFKFTAIPIPGFPHTGNILGAGTAARLEWTIKGNEYDVGPNGEGHPWPLIGVNVFFPKGSKQSTAGFPTCSRAAVVAKGEAVFGTPECPLKSLLTFPVKAPQPIEPATACTTVLKNESYGVGVVRFGKEVTCEKSRVTGWIAPGGKLEFLADGVTPALFEEISVGTVTNGSTPKTTTVVPPIETVRGAAFASVEKIVVNAGAAIKKGKKTIYYGTVPAKCPKGGKFPLKTELIFAENGEFDANKVALKPVRVTKEYLAPAPAKCPKK